MVTISTYLIPAGTTVYYGPIDGGSVYQYYVPDSFSADVQLLKTEALPGA